MSIGSRENSRKKIINVTLNVLVLKGVTIMEKLGERRYNKPLYDTAPYLRLATQNFNYIYYKCVNIFIYIIYIKTLLALGLGVYNMILQQFSLYVASYIVRSSMEYDNYNYQYWNMEKKWIILINVYRRYSCCYFRITTSYSKEPFYIIENSVN